MRGAEELAESHIAMVLSVHRWEWFLVVLVDPFLDMQSPNERAEVAGTWEEGSPSPWKAVLQPRLLPSASQLLHWKIGGPGYNLEDSWVSVYMYLCVYAHVLVHMCWWAGMNIACEPPQPSPSQRASPAAFRGCLPALWASDLVVFLEDRAHVFSSGASTQSGFGPQVGQRLRVADRRLGCSTELSNHGGTWPVCALGPCSSQGGGEILPLG